MIILTDCGGIEFLEQNQIKESGAASSTGSFFMRASRPEKRIYGMESFKSKEVLLTLLPSLNKYITLYILGLEISKRSGIYHCSRST